MSSTGLSTPPHVVNVGADLLAEAVAGQAVPVTNVDWRPPMPGTEADLATVALDPLRHDANARALAAVLDVRARLVDVAPASELLGLERGQFLHAGPPIDWARAPGPLRGALMGARGSRGARVRPRGRRRALRGGLVGVARAVPPPVRGRSDGRGRVTLRCGCGCWRTPPPAGVPSARSTKGSARCCGTAPTDPRCSSGCAGWPTCWARCSRRQCGRAAEPVDVTGILTQMLQMGDEAHNRNRAGTLMLLRDLGPSMVTSGAARRRRRRGAALRGRQRPLLPQPGDAGLQARTRRRARHRRLDDGRGDGAQRHRLRHPDRRHRRRVVHGAGPARRRPLPRRLRPRRRQPRHRRLGHHRDRRASAASRWPRLRRSCASLAGRCRTRWLPPGGCTRSRWARTRAGPCRSWSSRARRPGSTCPRSAGPGSSRRSTPAWPARSPGSARSARASSRRRPRSSRRRSPRSPGVRGSARSHRGPRPRPPC